MRGNVTPYHTVGYPLPWGFNGRLAGAYRWFSGRPMNGHRYTDATGFHYGTMALDPSGNATSYQLLPGALRFAYARLPIMAAPAYAADWWLDPRHAAVVTAGLATLAAYRTARWRARRTFRRQVIEPVSAVASSVLRTKRVAGRGHTWVDVPVDIRDNELAKVKIMLPVDWIGQDGDRAALVQAVGAKLAMPDMVATWSMHGSCPHILLAQPPAPPDTLSLTEVMATVDELDEDELMVGLGPRGKTELASLSLESPHFLINGGSGAGKSELLAFLIGQLMRRGYGVLVLDAKFVSHMWLRRVPGVHYAAEAEDLHNALVWLDGELLRRARMVSSSNDVDDAASRLIPLVVVLEEINGATNRLRAYWKSVKGPEDPMMSPALTALANLANMGRELRVHVLMAGQSLTAKSTGGPEGRESFGGRFLARATSNAWRMLAPQIKPAPVKRERPGRWRLVVGDMMKHFQVPFCDLKNASSPDSVARLIGWATGGRPVPDVTALMAGWGEEQPETVETAWSEDVPPSDVSLKDYADDRGVDLAWLRRQVERRPEAPKPVRVAAGNTRRYAWGALDAFVIQRKREPVSSGD